MNQSFEGIDKKLDRILRILEKTEDKKETIIYESKSFHHSDDDNDSADMTELYKCIHDKTKHKDDFEILINERAHHNTKHVVFKTLLEECMRAGRFDFAHYLIEKGLVNIKISDIVSILFEYQGLPDCSIDYLIQHKAWPYGKLYDYHLKKNVNSHDDLFHPIKVFSKYLDFKELEANEAQNAIDTFSKYVETIKENISKRYEYHNT